MRIDLLTLFPSMCRHALRAGVLGRAIESDLVRAVVTDIRQFTGDRHGTVDDNPYGGGAGMIMRVEPAVEAVESVRTEGARVILATPAGQVFRQSDAEELAEEDHLIFLCGRYKGFDERVRELVVTDEFSLGDYIISGGELAALVMTDAIVRRRPGTLNTMDSADTDSFSSGRSGYLDAAYYTRPLEYRGLKVPDVLLSGDHRAIDEWREEDSRNRTAQRRPDLLSARDEKLNEGGGPPRKGRR